MTQAELDFYSSVPKALKDLANEVHTLNKNIKQLIETQQVLWTSM